MEFPGILALAVGLAMDATAVSAARGLAAPRLLARHVLSVALFFGGFQALMPLFGWLVGSRVGAYVAAWDHWIVFAVFASLGGKMLWEARKGTEPAPAAVGAGPGTGATGEAASAGAVNAPADLFGVRVMLLLAVATSIDAFAAGVTLPMLEAPVALSLATIGVTTALLSAAGLFAGRRFGAMLGRRLDAVGGIVLLALAVKALLEG